ncbi:RNA polymerase sigma-70 factor [Marinifilum sp. D737]|uniref:RNA polymerase sigma-70 factor n=1 Tax=Marinifilum sp. D737 TaxID=2969628 RepID=UPI0022748C17|nr:RNA polymerase sigma-70 factor [Marinifilum sp. D737]MCY1636550.1 RNA polymerase sigma-70 factor [Marinifilum sp. D737]
MSRLLLNRTNFEQLFKEHYDSLYYYAYSIVNDDELAKDMVNDSFEEIWNRRNKLDISYSLKSFLYRMVKNRCLNHLKKQEVERKYIDRSKQSISEELDEYKDYEPVMAEIMKAIEQLPEQGRKVFTKCFIENLSYKEAAEDLNVSVNTIKTHVVNSLKRLRKDLDKDSLLFFLLFRNGND